MNLEPDMPRPQALEVRDNLVGRLTAAAEAVAKEWPGMPLADLMTAFDEAKNRFTVEHSAICLDDDDFGDYDPDDLEDDEPPNAGEEWKDKKH